MKVITCFSYKGGAGRTTAAANIAAALASMVENVGSIERPLRRKVAIVDLDVFSAGTHRLFGISNPHLEQFTASGKPCVQDYLRDQMAPSSYVQQGGIKLDDPFMKEFRMERGADDNCHPDFTLFPARPDPDTKFAVQKQHENVLIELLMELESGSRRFDYVILDGESGTRQMADIALRLSDVVLMFFRLTWQHIEGTLNTANDFLNRPSRKDFYLIPTCVPPVEKAAKIYQNDAPGLQQLLKDTVRIPDAARLNDFAEKHREKSGYFWAEQDSGKRMCIHDSLYLKGEERVLVFEGRGAEDPAAKDCYEIAVELDQRYGPSS